MARTSRWRLFGDAALPRRRRPFDPCCHMRQDDDDDDFDMDRSRRVDEGSTTAGMIGFIASMMSAGLLVVVVILWYFLRQENERQANAERTRWMLYWFLLTDFLSFCGGLAGVILTVRGLSPANRLYRGWSMAGLILAIIEIIVTIILGIIMTCVALVFQAFG